jgi:hypothetical protein
MPCAAARPCRTSPATTTCAARTNPSAPAARSSSAPVTRAYAPPVTVASRTRHCR